MLTKIMMWVSIAVVLLALLELPVTSEPVLVEFVVCATALLVICQAVRAGQYLLGTGFLPIIVAFSPISPILISGRTFLWLNWISLAAFLVAVITLKTERTLSMPSIMNVFASHTNIDIGCGSGIGWGHELLRRDSEGLSSVGNLGKYQIEGSADSPRWDSVVSFGRPLQ